MAGETTITLVGNLTADPEPALHPLRCGSSELHRRVLSGRSSRLTNGGMAMRCASTTRCGARLRRNVAESLQKGMQVIVQGRLRSRSYETRDGERRTVLEDRCGRDRPCAAVRRCKVTRN